MNKSLWQRFKKIQQSPIINYFGKSKKIFLIALFIKIIYLSLIFYYTVKLNKLTEKCYCAESFELKYIKYFTIFAILVSIITFLHLLACKKEFCSSMFSEGFRYIIIFSYILFIIILSLFMLKIKKNKCKCAESWILSFIIFYILAFIAILISSMYNKSPFDLILERRMIFY
jgi:hypothetical protein